MPSMADIDFLPESVRHRRRRRAQLIRQGNLLVIAVVGLVVLGIFKNRSTARAQAELSLLKDRTANVRQQLALRSQLEAQQAQLLVKKHIDDQLGSRIGATDVLKELQRVLPPSVTLTNLTMEVIDDAAPQTPRNVNGTRPIGAAPPRKAPTLRRVQIQLTGMAPQDVDVATFIANLSASRVFEQVSMGYAKTVEFDHPVYVTPGKPTKYERRTGREFQASCFVIR